eukprot:6203790-Pleurochrysis_carterae.AAC.2
MLTSTFVRGCSVLRIGGEALGVRGGLFARPGTSPGLLSYKRIPRLGDRVVRQQGAAGEAEHVRAPAAGRRRRMCVCLRRGSILSGVYTAWASVFCSRDPPG